MDFLKKLPLKEKNPGSSTGSKWYSSKTAQLLEAVSPVDGKIIATVNQASAGTYERIVKTAQEAFLVWRDIPAPKRGEVIRQVGNKVRQHKEALGALISYEMGKSLQEGLGEVQEMIDICDFAVGQSRMLYGLAMHSERLDHRMYEQYHPLGVIGIITAFNFPVAVWAWNAMIAAVCGDVVLWKPSSQVPLSAIAVHKIAAKVIKEHNLPEGILNLVIGPGQVIGEKMLSDKRLPLLSFTGSVASGYKAAKTVNSRLGRTLLELGGNNAIIITQDADLKIAIPAVVFGAVGTAGQRCTTTRRLIVHEQIYDQVKEALITAYQSLKIGNPLDEKNHVGPLTNKKAVEGFLKAISIITQQNGTILTGGKTLEGAGYESGCYVEPTIVEAAADMAIIQEETFAPILYLIKYQGEVTEAIQIQNNVRQGLSSAIFTADLHETEEFLSHRGSDCGIANVNIGTSGAEIGGAFGGEKETGGGRESGSDAWRAYMRRQTVTVNYGKELPLAQGIKFEIG